MPSTREIRRRIGSAKNVSQITRAMEMVAASRMRRAQQAVTAGRPYAEKIEDVIQNLAARISSADQEEVPALLRARPIKSVAVILITADRGLAGALNTNVIRRALRFIQSEVEGVPVELIAVGKKGRDFMVRYGRSLTAEFTGLGDRPAITDIIPIARVATDEYLSGRVDAVYIIYTDFVNTLLQRPTVYRLLPVDLAAAGDEGFVPGDNEPRSMGGPATEYIFEPGTREVLEALVPRYIEVRLYQALLEHQASEQSARMVAMRNATENAKEMISELTLAYNKLRQANITREIIEISSGAAAQQR
ncbi:MAG TPA: ATP synthase F1 subunit gamma [Chloroflexia bacterium]|nr:ATP synthase F1 subunit gamma [Chloroflexia bacterium]